MRVMNKLLHDRAIYGAFTVLLLWQLIHVVLKCSIVPGPYETILLFLKLIKGELLLHLLVSFLRITAAIVISIMLGVPLGLWLGINKKADEIISPVAYILYPIPKIAFLPVFMIIFGLGNGSKIILIVTIVFFQILLAARDGVKEIPTELFYSVKSLGLNQRQTYRELVFPASLPKIISALRISIGISISVLFFGENFATTYGIGYFIMNSWIMVDYTAMFAGILAISMMGMFIFKLIDMLERKLCPWIFIHETDRS